YWDLACTSDRRRPEIRTCRYNDVSITIGLQLDQETLSMELHYPGGVRAFACAFAAPEVGAGAGIRHACGSDDLVHWRRRRACRFRLRLGNAVCETARIADAHHPSGASRARLARDQEGHSPCGRRGTVPA